MLWLTDIYASDIPLFLALGYVGIFIVVKTLSDNYLMLLEMIIHVLRISDSIHWIKHVEKWKAYNALKLGRPEPLKKKKFTPSVSFPRLDS